MDTDGAHIQFAACGAFIERLDVLQNMFKGQPTGRNQILGQGVKHKGIVRIRRMPQSNRAIGHDESNTKI